MMVTGSESDGSHVVAVASGMPTPAGGNPTTAGGNPRTAGLTAQYVAHERLARVARRQFGVFTVEQAQRAGIRGDAVARLRDRGLVVRRARGIYVFRAVPDSRESRWLVALLRHGPSAVLSHRTAGSVHGLEHGLPRDAIHLTVPSRSGVQPAGYVLHRGRLVPDIEVTVRGPLRVTSVARNLCELAGELDEPERVRRVVAEALRRGLVDVPGLRAAVTLRRRFPGRAALRRVLDELSPLEPHARHELESLFLQVAAGGGVAPTAMNHPITDADGRRRVLDAVWHPAGVYAELDSRRFHGTLVDWHDDLRRENAVSLAGYTLCLRFSWWDLQHHPDLVIDTIRRALAAAD